MEAGFIFDLRRLHNFLVLKLRAYIKENPPDFRLTGFFLFCVKDVTIYSIRNSESVSPSRSHCQIMEECSTSSNIPAGVKSYSSSNLPAIRLCYSASSSKLIGFSYDNTR